MSYAKHFDIEDRQELLLVLETINMLAARRESALRLFGRLAVMMSEICGNAELIVDDNFVSFSGVDHCRYYASAAGLWCFDGNRGFLVAPHKWWLAALQTRAWWMRLNRRAPEVVARSARFELKGA